MSTMAVLSPTDETLETFADLHARLGGVPLDRILCHPAPGTATEADVLRYAEQEPRKRLCELVDGVLVEKAVGFYESLLAATLIRLLGNFLDVRDLGIVLGADATLRLSPGQVRIPDVSFIAWERFPNRELPAEPMPDLPPDLAVEVMSASNTRAEMARKLRDYFAAGVRLVWYVYPEQRTVHVYTSLPDVRVFQETDVLDGGVVLPGFQLTLQEWFARAGHRRG